MGLTGGIKGTMNDPSSYEHVDTRYADEGDYLIVTTRFRGKSTLGGVVTNTLVAKVDLDGHIVEVISRSPLPLGSY